MNKRRFEAEMKLRGLTRAHVANMLGIARNTLSLKLNEKGTEFTQSEMELIKKEWGLDAEAMDDLFFTKSVS